MSATLTPEDVEYLRVGYRLFREHDPAFMDRSFELICDSMSFAAALAEGDAG